MDERGIITGTGPFEGLDRFEARAGGAWRRCASRAGSSPRSGPYLHAVGHCSRCDDRRRAAAVAAVVRPGRPAGQGGRATRCATAGSRSTRRSWSRATSTGSTTCTTGASRRQLWWGHRIPVWYGPDGEVRLPRPGRATAAAGEGWRQDDDVLDTWFSSRAVAVLHARLAGRHRRPAALLPDRRAGHRLRHHLLLGRPDDDVRPLRDGRRPAVPHASRCTGWSATSTAGR